MTDELVIETQNLSKNFSGFQAVQGVNLRVRANTIHALIGPNGAGKTTLFNLITRFLDPSGGRILYRDQDITRAHPARLAQRGIVRSFQISAVFPHLSVLDNLRLALQRRHGQALAFWRPPRSFHADDDRAEELLASVGLVPFAGKVAHELPYGRKRALELATTLALDPDVLLLDEPLAGMNHADIDGTARLITQAAHDRTVLMVEHNLNVVARICDRITVLCRGEVLAEGSYAEVSAHPEVVAAYMGKHGNAA